MVKILDCTLRDGGYVNNWEFGTQTISSVATKLSSAAVELIECGFLSQTKATSYGQSVFRTIEAAEELFCEISANLALMINCGEYKVEDIPPYNNGNIKTLRIAFHKHQRNEAQQLFVGLKEKGYCVFFQPMVTMSYSDRELLDLIDWANEYQPDAFYLVDSFGTMRKEDVLRMFSLIHNNLVSKIAIGFHSHNNLQLSFSNAQALVGINKSRELYIDSSVFGMGRGAGNLCTELFAQYINENIEKRYDMLPILEVMDECIIPIYNRLPWGYSAPYYVAAINDCHPNYATYLVNKQSLHVRDINTILKNIPADKRRLYDVNLITELYLEYQSHNVDDASVIEALADFCQGKRVLLLAPGKTLIDSRKEIESYIEGNRGHLIVIGINHIPEYYAYDLVFISNLKRFKDFDKMLTQISDRVICTSNITAAENVKVVNYSSYLNEDEVIGDNSGLMLINILRKAGVKDFALAGFDGFNLSNNYYNEKLVSATSYENHLDINNSMIAYFEKMNKLCHMQFITPSLYVGEF